MSIQRNDEQAESFALGSSIYGGRPTFALVRHETGNEATVTLYELLPTEQADARNQRLERRRLPPSKTLPLDKVVGRDTNEFEEWDWTNWVAVKVSQLSGSRLRSLLQLIDEILRKADIKPEKITSTGSATILLPEASGVRLSLGFIGIKPLRRVDRMRDLARGVMQMSLEECYYWNAKCRSPNNTGGAKALRILLTE